MSDSRRKVLIVDDEPDARAFVETILSEIADFEIFEAGDGEAGVLRAKAEIPDLIILDVNMPVKDGFSTFFDIRNDPCTAHIPVIMLTGVAKVMGMQVSGSDMKDFLGIEPNAFLDKPVSPMKLDETVRKILGIAA